MKFGGTSVADAERIKRAARGQHRNDALALLARLDDPPRGALDPLGVGHRGPAELHHHGAGHGLAV
jgi:hypothetical protein